MKNVLLLLSLLCSQVYASDSVSFKRNLLVYGYRDGHALVMEHVEPHKPNGRGIIAIINGNFRSDPASFANQLKKHTIYLDAGFSLFLVATSSQPRYAIPEQLEDVKRSIRYVISNASKFEIDPNKLGLTGSSSGGNLSLLAATASEDFTSDTLTGRIAAVAVFYPPTDFINYGRLSPSGKLNYNLLRLTGLTAAFDFKRWNDTTRTYVSETDTTRIRSIVEKLSPVNSLSPDDPPVYIIHGEKDILVPLQQSQLFAETAKRVGVPVILEVKPGASHGWPGREDDDRKFALWFREILQ